jgi:hypothetical protein
MTDGVGLSCFKLMVEVGGHGGASRRCQVAKARAQAGATRACGTWRICGGATMPLRVGGARRQGSRT